MSHVLSKQRIEKVYLLFFSISSSFILSTGIRGKSEIYGLFWTSLRVNKFWLCWVWEKKVTGVRLVSFLGAQFSSTLACSVGLIRLDIVSSSVCSSWSRFSSSFWASGTSLLILSTWSSFITQIVSSLSTSSVSSIIL